MKLLGYGMPLLHFHGTNAMKIPNRITAERVVNLELLDEFAKLVPDESFRMEDEENISQLKFDLSDATNLISVLDIGMFVSGVGVAIFNVLKRRKDTSINIRLANGKSLSIQASEDVKQEDITRALTDLLGDKAE